jgi:hypothetical protein
MNYSMYGRSSFPVATDRPLVFKRVAWLENCCRQVNRDDVLLYLIEQGPVWLGPVWLEMLKFNKYCSTFVLFNKNILILD